MDQNMMSILNYLHFNLSSFYRIEIIHIMMKVLEYYNKYYLKYCFKFIHIINNNIKYIVEN